MLFLISKSTSALVFICSGSAVFGREIVPSCNAYLIQSCANIKPCKKSFDRFRNLLIILSRLCYTFIHSMILRFVIVFRQLNYTNTIGFMLFLCQLLLNFRNCEGTEQLRIFKMHRHLFKCEV